MITIKIAGLVIGINNRFERMNHFVREYLTDEEPMFIVDSTEEDVLYERTHGMVGFEDDYVESMAIYRKIAERLPEYDAFLFHGAVILIDGAAYIISASSGVGKTTHMRLWLSEFSDVRILNGDKPIVRIIDGIPYACGTPWRGKENYGENITAPIKGFVLLERGEKNKAYRITPEEAVIKFMSQVYLPIGGRASLLKTMSLADKVIKSATLVHLECNMQPEAAHVCRKALFDSDDSSN